MILQKVLTSYLHEVKCCHSVDQTRDSGGGVSISRKWVW